MQIYSLWKIYLVLLKHPVENFTPTMDVLLHWVGPKSTQICFSSVLIMIIIVISNTKMMMMAMVKIMLSDGVDENDGSKE